MNRQTPARERLPPNTTRLTACRAGDIVVVGEKGGFKFLYACWSEIFIPIAYPIPRSRASTLKDPIFMLLKRLHGLEIAHVKQVIRAVAIPAATALELQVAAGSPGLLQLLKFYAADGQLFDAAASLYPSDRYSFNWQFHATEAG